MTEFVVKYWLETLFGVIVSVMGWMLKKMNKKMNEQEAIRAGVQALLKNAIVEKYEKSMDDGYCPIHVRDSIMAMAKEYYNLGGNGTIPSLMDKIQCLPTTPPEDDEGE